MKGIEFFRAIQRNRGNFIFFGKQQLISHDGGSP
jgi:hypothetical protein